MHEGIQRGDILSQWGNAKRLVTQREKGSFSGDGSIGGNLLGEKEDMTPSFSRNTEKNRSPGGEKGFIGFWGT